MADLPPSVRKCVLDLMLQSRAPAYLHVDGTGRVEAAGGDLSRYGLGEHPVKRYAADAVPALLGLVPLQRGDDPLFLPTLELEGGIVADLLVVEDRGTSWVVLLDATESRDRRQALQQSANDLALLKQKVTRLLTDRTEGRARGGSIDAVAFREAGEHREVTVVRVDVSPALGTAADAPTLVTRTDTLTSRVAESMQQAGALTEISTGSGVISVFGLIHGQGTHADTAVSKAIGVIGRETFDGDLDLTAGVATGSCVMALVKHDERPSLLALGHTVSTACRLACTADRGHVLIDEASFRQAAGSREAFRPAGALEIPGGTTIDLYSTHPS